MQHAKPTVRKLKKTQTTALMKRMVALLCVATLVLSTPLQSLAYDITAAEDLSYTASESTEDAVASEDAADSSESSESESTADDAEATESSSDEATEAAAESTEDADTDGTDGIDGTDGTDSTDSSAGSTDATEESSAADTSDTSDTEAASPIITDTATLLSNVQTLATQELNGITIIDSLDVNGANYDYTVPSGAQGWIYFSDISSSGSASVSVDGKTLTDGSITITLNADGLSFATGSSSDYGAYDVVANRPTTGSTVVYGSDANPALTITITNAGYTSSGQAIDIVYTISTVSVYSYTESSESTVDILQFFDGRSVTLTGFEFSAPNDAGAGVMTDCTVSIYYSGTSTLASGYGFIWKIVDLDVVSRPDTGDYTGAYAESIVFKSGFTNPIYTTTSSYLVAETVEIDGTNYTRLRADYVDSNTLDSGFMTTLTTGTFSFQWRGSGCATGFCVGLSQDSYSAGLAIGKTVSGNNPDTTKEFSYTLTLDGSALTGVADTSYTLSKSDGTSTQITFDSSSKATATFTLKAGQTVSIYDLPTGVTYTVQEITATDSNYKSTVTYSGSTSEILTANGTVNSDTLTSVVFDSERLSGDLTISKTVSKTYADTSDETFTFTVTLTDTFADSSSNVITDSFSVSGSATSGATTEGIPSSVTFTADGTTSSATITLKDGQTATITGLPSGVSYTVEETDYDAGFTITSKSGDTGTISATTTSTAAFTNTTSKDFTVTIYKFATGDIALAGAEYSIVALNDSSETSKQTATTESDGTITVSNLEALTIYKVTETKAAAGYYLLGDGESFYIKIVDGKLQLVNTSGTVISSGSVTFDGSGTVSLNSTNALQVDVESTLNTTSALWPSTGGSGTLFIFASGIALMALAAYALYRQRRSMRTCAAHAASHAVASPWQARAASRPQPTRRRTQ